MGVFCVIFVYAVSLSIIWAENDNAGVILTTGRWDFPGESSLVLVNWGLQKEYSRRTLKNDVVDSCDVDVERKLIYLFDMLQRRIIVGSDFDLRLKTNEFTPVRSVVADENVQIAVDWVSHNIYWTDPVLGTVMIQPGRPDIGRSLYRIIAHLQEPCGLAVDPVSGFLFWIDKTKDPYNNQVKYQIESSSLTGKDRKVVFATSLSQLNALTIDVEDKRIYYSKDDYLESFSYDGEDRRHISMYTQSYPNFKFFDIATYKGTIYATDEEGNVFRGLNYFPNLKGSSLCVFDKQKQPAVENDSCKTAGCADICVNENGSATCLCRNGFDLQQDGKNCTETSGDYHRAIILNNGTHLCLLSMDVLSDKETKSIFCFYRHETDEEQILYVDVDMDTRVIFFATLTSIYRVAINRTQVAKPELIIRLSASKEDPRGRGSMDDQLRFEAHEPKITGLSYNWVTKQLCWSQIQPDGVFIRDQEANIMTIKQNDGTKHPKEPVFVQYAMKEYLFWISYLGNESVIVTTPVDGGNDTRPQMLREKLHNISRLQHDVKNKQLVLMSQGEMKDRVSYLTYNGNEKDSFDINSTWRVSSFAQYKDVFLSAGLDEANQTILRLHDIKAKPKANVTLQEFFGPARTLKLIDLENLQPSVPDPCAIVDSGSLGCNQICVPEDGQAKCFCDIGYHLVNRTCETAPVEDNFILVTDFTHGKLYQIPLMAPQTIHGIHPRPADRIEAIAYDETAKEIILVEVQFTQVWSISLDGEWNDKIVDLADYQGWPFKLALDHTCNYIYFIGIIKRQGSTIQHRSNIIGVIATEPSGTKSRTGYSTIIYHADSVNLMDLALYPNKGLMFWTDWTDDRSNLWRANMDGSEPTSLASGGREYYRLTIDYQDDHLYWSEYQRSTIYRSTLKGTDIEEFYSDRQFFVNYIKMVGDYLYYSAFTSVHITRVNKHNTSDVTTFGPDAGIGAIRLFDVFASNDTVNMTRHAACMIGNGGCSHFCLPRADGERTCACMYNVKLLSDNKTCDVPKCPREIPNGRLPDSCSNRAGKRCDNFTCDEEFERNKIVDSLICNESGHWSYDRSTLCIPIDKDSDKDKRVLIIGVLAGGSLLIVIVSTVVILYALVRKGKILANFRWSKTSDVSSDLPSNLDDSGVADTSVSYIDHLSWLRTRINQFLILDDDADKALAGPDDRHR